MGKIRNAFENSNTQEGSFLLGRLFSSPIIRGFYKDEKPAIDIKLEGSRNEKRRLISLINTIANNSPTGRRILETAAEAGFTFGFECQLGSYGFCDPSEKRICLNPVTNDAELTTTLTHEARHAQQYANGVPNKFCAFDVATEIKLRRATEADAQAAAAQTALEIRASTKDEKVWNAFEHSDRLIARSVYRPPLSESLSSVVAASDRNMQNAFEGWFKDKQIINAYEESYLYAHLTNIEKQSKTADKVAYFAHRTFEGHKTSAEILNMVCLNEKGKCYFSDDVSIMDLTPSMCGLCQETRAAADAFFQEREQITGQAPDTSYKDLPDRGRLPNAIETKLAMMNGLRQKPENSGKSTKKTPLKSLVARIKKARQER
ncbi:MAG: hypothetical protein J5716_01080 [Alphaproteobacteria bacterium]|nr:hypothetical protein [Alphaproteobacteria bacterium]